MTRRAHVQIVCVLGALALSGGAVARPPVVEPPGLIADELGSIRATPGDASMSLPAALERVAPAGSDVPSSSAVRSEAPARAVMKYASAYARFLEGNLTGARSDASDALRMDPESIEAMLLLGRIERRLGRALSARRYFEGVLAVDPWEPQAALALSADALRVGNAEEALRVIAPWARGDGIEAWMKPLVMDRVARALARRGYLDAAVEAAEQVAPSGVPGPEWAREQADAALRSRGMLWMALGDLALALGDAQRALDLYDEAERRGEEAPAALDTRRVYALVVGGRMEEAIGLVARRIESTRGADGETRALVRYLVERGASRERLVGAIGAVARSLDRASDAGSASLRRLAASAQPAAEAIETLSRHVGEHPTDEASMSLMLDIAASEVGAEEAWSRAVAVVSASPWQAGAVARAFVSAVDDPAVAAAVGEDESSPGSTLLSGLVQWRLGRERAAGRLLASCALDPALDGAGIAPAARLAHMRGSLPEAMAVVEGADAGSSAGVRRGVAEALGELTLTERALEVLAPDLDGGADAQTLYLAGRLARDRGALAVAADLFERAWRADPYLHRAAAALLGLIAPGRPAEDEARAAGVVREIRRVDPSSPVLGWVRVQSRLANGQLEVAAHELRLLLEEHPGEETFAVALAEVLASDGRADEAAAWLESCIDRTPGSGELRLALARVRIGVGEYNLAADVLEDWIERFPGDFACSKLLERVYGDYLSMRLTADEFTQARLERMPRTVDVVLEDLALRVSKKRLDEAAAVLEELSELVPTPTEAVALRLRGVAEDLMLRTAMNDAQIQQAIGLLRQMRTEFTIASSPELLGLELMLSARASLTDEQLLELATRAERSRLLPPGEATVRLGEAIRDPGRPFQNRRDFNERRQRSLRFLQRAASDGGSTARVQAEWLYAAMDLQDFGGLADALELALDRGTMGQVMEHLSTAGKVAPFGADWESGMRWTVSVMNELGRERAADAAYEGVLHFSPEDPGACNDLGYRLLERGEQIGRAIALIETAYRQVPDDAATADSMGWARYIEGRIEDEVDPVTGERSPGAIWYLNRSLELIGNATDNGAVFNTIVAKSHLGDAYWAVGDAEMARSMWSDAASLGERLLGLFGEGELAPAGEELRGIVEGSREKVRAVDAGEAPGVTPIIGPVDADTISTPGGRNGDSGRGRS